MVLLSGLFLVSIACEKKHNTNKIENSSLKENDIVFKNKKLNSIIDNIISEQFIVPTNGYNSLLIYFHINKADTIMSIINHPPYEKDKLQACCYYNNYQLYFYAPKNLEHKLASFILFNSENKSAIRLHENDSMLIYQEDYIINKGEIRPRY